MHAAGKGNVYDTENPGIGKSNTFTVTGSHVAIGHQLSAVSGGRWLIRLIPRLEWQF